MRPPDGAVMLNLKRGMLRLCARRRAAGPPSGRLPTQSSLPSPATREVTAGNHLAPRLLYSWFQEAFMKYGIAWLLGLPFSIIILWFLANQAGCGL